MNLLYFYRNKTDLFIKHVLLFTVLLFATKSNAQCSDHWYIDTQTKLNSFTGCTHIPISITITGTVYNLSPLSNVVSIGGDLNISHAHSLQNLDALSSLTSIGGNIAIYSNNSLTNVNGLGNITSSNILTMQILENPNLTSIAGLGNLNTNSINYLQISGNPLLTECDIASVCTHLPRNWNTYINNNGIGCESIQAVSSSCAPCQPPINFSATNKTSRTASINWTGFPGGNIYNIEYGAAGFTPGTGTQVNNFAGTSYTVTGLSELTTYDIYVKRVNLSCEWGFSQKYTFTTIAECPPAGETLVMTNQQEINNFGSTYPFCVNMPGSIQIYEFMGSQITSLAALSNLESINGSFSLSRTSILNLNDLVNLERIGGDLYINNNSVLANVDGLSSLTSVGMQNSLYNRVAFTDNPLLQNLNGLSALTTVGGALDISNNHILNSLSGLSSLISVNVTNSSYYPESKYLSINNNGQLVNLNGLSSLVNANGSISITNNGNLINISALQNINSNTITGLTITNNVNLSVCNTNNICTFLQSSGGRNISGNLGDCINTQILTETCGICATPSQLNTTKIVSNFAKFNWTSIGVLFDIEWGVAGFTPGTGTMVTGLTGNSYDLSGLNELTSYDVYIRRHCLNSTTTWVKHTFSTISICPLYTSNFYFYSQQEVDDYKEIYPNCTNINGDLVIDGSSITDLSPLDHIVSVGGILQIKNTQVTDISLPNLETLNGDFTIFNNPVASNLSFPKLTTINNLGLFSLGQVTNLNGLSTVTNIVGYFSISDLPFLNDISGLKDTSLGNVTSFSINDNPNLSVCNIESVCTYIKGQSHRSVYNNGTGCHDELAIYSSCDCDAPTNVTGTGIVSNSATFNWTSNFTDPKFDIEWGTTGFAQGTGTIVNGLTNPTYTVTNLNPSTTYDFYVRQDCTFSKSIWVLYTFTTPSICPSGNLVFSSQEGINSFGSTYPNCTNFSGNLTIEGNDISDLSPLNNIVSIGGHLLIKNNTVLTSINGLTGLTTLFASLKIEGNTALQNLNGLSNLISLAHGVAILNNAELTNIDGLSTIASINNAPNNGIQIVNNPLLAVCNIDVFCNYLVYSPSTHPRTISNNALGCESDSIINFNCLPTCEAPTDIIASEITFNDTTISWTSDGTSFDIEWGITGFTQGNGTILENLTQTTYNLTELTGATSYDVYVQKNCNGNESVWVKHTFTTPNCDVPTAVSSSSLAFDSTKVTWTSTGNLFEIEWGTAGFTQGSGTLISDIEATNYTFTELTGLTSYDVYVRQNCIGHKSDWVKHTFTSASCPTVNSLATSNVTYNSAKINWQSNGSSFEIEYGPYNFTHGNGTLISGITTNTYTFTELNHSATYDVYVRQDCEGSKSNWSRITVYTDYPCPFGNTLTFTTQQQIDDFGTNYPGCTEIWGDLNINHQNPNSSTINNLAPLNNIQIINGDLTIRYSGNLYSLNGLNSLHTVTENVTFENTYLSNLDGLYNLTHVGGTLRIGINNHLIDISGIKQINASELDYLLIRENPHLSICNYKLVCDYLSGSNSHWIELNGSSCSNTASILASCSYCNAPYYITKEHTSASLYTIKWTSTANNFDIEWGVSGFERGTGTLINAHGPNKFNFTGFEENTTYDIYIRSNCTSGQSGWVLMSFTTAKTCPTEDLEFNSQNEINQFKIDYPFCTEINGYLFIEGNDIYSLSGLSNIKKIYGRLGVMNCTILPNLNGLSNLNYLGNGFFIIANPLITTLTPLQNAELNPNDQVFIYDNPQLSTCNIPFLCSYLGGNGWADVYNNASGCDSTVEISYNCGFECPTGAVYLNTQAQVNAFGANFPNCTQIDYLEITGSDITDLSPLQNITSITGGLSIYENSVLSNLNGLNNISTIGWDLYIYDNPALTNIDGLIGLTNVSESIEIYDNQALININGLGGITQIYEGIEIYANESLANINGLNSVTQISGGIEIYENESLANVNGLNSVTQISGGIDIYKNESLANINGLNLVTQINGGIEIYENDILTNLNGLNSLSSISGNLFIYSNSSLVDITGLQNVNDAEIDYLAIDNNPLLTICNIDVICSFLENDSQNVYISSNAGNCENLIDVVTACGLEMPTCPEGDFYVYSQAEIDNFAINYPNCTEIAGSLFITYSEDITNFNAFSNITSVAGNIEISDNYNLTNLDGLTSITSIDGGIYIYWNPDLVDISGLINIDHATINELYIADNEGLSVCNISNFCTYLSNPENERTIEYNSGDCYDNHTLSMQCDFNFCPSGYVEITSQEEIDNFTTIYPNCTQITGSLQISGDDITDLSPLNGIESVSDWFSIYDCPQLNEINGLTNLTHIGTDIYIGYNDNLTSLEGLSGVTHSTNYIYIEFNPLLESLTGLNYLSTFEGQILIVGNENLTDISNLQAIEAENIYYLNIEDNENLEICNLTNFCAFLSNPDSYYYISGNSQNCSSAEIILGNCLSENCDATTIWNGNFWTNGIPDNTKKVIIEADLFVSDELEACKLVINEGTLIIESGAVLRVEGIIENNLTAENLIVHSGADLIQTSNDSNIGEITVYRNSSPLYRQDYTLWSSPVKEQNLRSFSPQTVYNRFYSYDTTIGTKGDYAQELFTTADVNTKNFIDAKGYMIRMPNNWTEYVDQNTPGTTFEGQFVGAANNGNISIPISTANIGLNLVGNPYASAISITEFFTANPTIANTLYFWRKRNDALGSGYATYTALGLQSSHLPFGSDLNDKIMPGQGFFIMTQGPTTLTFNNAMRTTSQDGLFLRSSNTNKHRYWLNLTANNNIIGQTLIGYTENATQGIDNGLDGAYFNDSSISLTSLINESEFAIQARSLPFENNDIVPLGFKTNVDGTYKISLHAFDGLFEENQDIYIKDNYTGNEHNLKLSDYEFVTSSGIFNNRFNVIYQTTLGTKNPEMNYNSIVLYKQNNQIHINSGEVAMKKVELYDVSGRLIYTKDAINDTRLSINQLSIENQMLIVKIHLENNTEKVRKIVY